MMEWGLITWVFDNPEFGWVVVLLYLYYEIHTKRGSIYTLRQQMLGSITVIRALARVENTIDTEKVDQYLAKNGVDPSDFIRERVTDGGIECTGKCGHDCGCGHDENENNK